MHQVAIDLDTCNSCAHYKSSAKGVKLETHFQMHAGSMDRTASSKPQSSVRRQHSSKRLEVSYAAKSKASHERYSRRTHRRQSLDHLKPPVPPSRTKSTRSLPTQDGKNVQNELNRSNHSNTSKGSNERRHRRHPRRNSLDHTSAIRKRTTHRHRNEREKAVCSTERKQAPSAQRSIPQLSEAGKVVPTVVDASSSRQAFDDLLDSLKAEYLPDTSIGVIEDNDESETNYAEPDSGRIKKAWNYASTAISLSRHNSHSFSDADIDRNVVNCRNKISSLFSSKILGAAVTGRKSLSKRDTVPGAGC